MSGIKSRIELESLDNGIDDSPMESTMDAALLMEVACS